MRIVAVPEYCLGCGLCEIYCAANHDGFKGQVLKAYKTGQPVSRSRLVYTGDGPLLNTCHNCAEAPCANACISAAIQTDANGAIFIDDLKCVSCYTCVMVCPYGHILPAGPKSVVKCDLCRENGYKPACVAHCPNEALVIEN